MSDLHHVFSERVTDHFRAQGDDIGVHDVRRYLMLIDAPHNLRYIDRAAAVMNHLIDDFENVVDSNDTADLAELNLWRRTNDAILDLRRELEALGIMLYPAGDDAAAPSAYGLKQRHPMYALLVHACDSSDLRAQYRCLKSVLFRCWSRCQETTSEDHMYRLGLAARCLGEAPARRVLAALPSEPLTVGAWSAAVAPLARLHDDADDDDLSYIAASVAVALNPRDDEPVRPDGGGGGGSGGGPARGVLLPAHAWHLVAQLDDLGDADDLLSEALFDVDDENTSRDCVDEDSQDDESLPATSVLEVVLSDLDHAMLDSTTLAVRLAGRQEALAMRMQSPIAEPSRLCVAELGDVLQHVTDVLGRDDLTREDLEVYTLIALETTYGRPVTELCALQIYRDAPKKLPRASSLAYVRADRVLHIRVQAPTVRMAPVQRTEALPTEPVLVLGCPPIVADALDRLIDTVPAPYRAGATCFQNHPASYENRIESILAPLAFPTVTQTRLRRYLFNQLLEKSTDVAYAMLVTGQRGDRALTRLHYTTAPCSTLEQLHRNTFSQNVDACVEEHELSADFARAWSIRAPTHPQAAYTGALMTPSRDAVRRLVATMKAELMRLRKDGPWYQYHNWYTAYTTLMLDFATGARATSRKYQVAQTWDTDARLFGISDKDGDYYYRSRLLRLPPICCAQFEAYKRHLKTTGSFLARARNDAHRRVTYPTRRAPRSYRVRQYKAFVATDLGCFFFLGPDYAATPYRPGTVMKTVRGVYHLRPNKNRNYLRSYLREREVCGEWVDAFLGHWQYGEEPGGRHSTLFLAQGLNLIASLVEELLGADGWEVIGDR